MTRRILTIPAAKIRAGDVLNLGEEAVTVTDHEHVPGYDWIHIFGQDESAGAVHLSVRPGLRFTVTREVTE